MDGRDSETGRFLPGYDNSGASKYLPQYAEQAYKLCLLGAIDTELANFFEVTVDTIHHWKKLHPEFLERLRAGKEQADAEVAHSLYERATGYGGAAPDTAACIFWLKNRQGKRWRDRIDNTHSDPDGGALVIKVVRFAGDNPTE